MVGVPPITSLVVPGGENAIEAFIVGQLRELRADEDNDSLRLHDGVKEGGYEFLNRDQSDARYQPFSPELLGFDFSAQEKGIVVRVGPAQYKIRRIQSDSLDLTIVNPRGTAGDFDLRISDTVTTNHTWDGTQTFVNRILAEGGLTGDTFGLHTGNVVGNVTGNLEGDAHGDHTGTFTGDVDVRSHNFVTDDGQILETQIDPEAWIRRGLPLGAIVMWSGTVATIPESFALCDGNNGTPDLRNRFIYGAGSGVTFTPPGNTGGSDSVSILGALAVGGAHTHPLSVDAHALTLAEIPAHHHGSGVCDGGGTMFSHGTLAGTAGDGILRDDDPGTLEAQTSDSGGGAGHTHTGATTESGAHSHDLTLDDATILPPYYALCFIMKIV